jgi:hypothetical protein
LARLGAVTNDNSAPVWSTISVRPPVARRETF